MFYQRTFSNFQNINVDLATIEDINVSDMNINHISCISASFDSVEFIENYSTIGTIDNLSSMNASLQNLSFTNTLNNVTLLMLMLQRF